jgi:hypothetical protein
MNESNSPVAGSTFVLGEAKAPNCMRFFLLSH